jgi:predicted GIY-YIG superfamily endonuclease
MWSIYLLYNPKTKRTYIGSTTDTSRRLRQHNRLIVGGARSTAKGAPDWQLIAYVTGFTGRSPACRWEKLAKLRARGLADIAAGVLPEGKGKRYQIPDGLTWVGVTECS